MLLRLGGGLMKGVEWTGTNATGTDQGGRATQSDRDVGFTRAIPSYKTVGAGQDICGRLAHLHLLVGPTQLYIKQFVKKDGNEGGSSEGNQESMSDSHQLQPSTQLTCRRPWHPSPENCPGASALDLMERIQLEFRDCRLLPTPAKWLQMSDTPCIMLVGSLAFLEVGLQAHFSMHQNILLEELLRMNNKRASSVWQIGFLIFSCKIFCQTFYLLTKYMGLHWK